MRSAVPGRALLPSVQCTVGPMRRSLLQEHPASASGGLGTRSAKKLPIFKV